VTADELRERADAAARELSDLVDGMDEATLVKQGPDGWAIKDHLAHLGAWELSTLALLDGRDREAAMGIPSPAPDNETAINDALWRLHRDKTAQEARRYLDGAHSAVMSRLAALDTADMERPYSYYQPQEGGEHRPVIEWIKGNTFEHYEEHIGWIKAQR
jgi:uncharacterized protein DUF1706